MHPVRSLAVYLAIVFLGGAFLAPWLYWLAQWGAAHFPGLEGIANNPFHRFLNRSLLIVALAGLWPFLRSLGIRNWKDVGLEKPRQHWRKLISGFGWGFISLAIITGFAVLAGARALDLDRTFAELAGRLLKAGLTASVVALVEELLFRGALFGALRRAHHWMGALFISSALYALVHFFSRPEPPGEVGWATGFALLPRMMRGFGDVEMLIPGFFNLALAGIILGYAFHRTGHLFFSIGLHAGWVFWLKTYGSLTGATPEGNLWIWGSGKLIDGWAALLVLSGLLGWLVWRFGKEEGEATKSGKTRSRWT
jgi:uncharacterized protein